MALSFINGGHDAGFRTEICRTLSNTFSIDARVGKEIGDLKSAYESFTTDTYFISDQYFNVDWDDIVEEISNGNKPFEIGEIIHEPWKNINLDVSYDNPWRVVHYEDVRLEDGSTIPAMWLENVYGHSLSIPYNTRAPIIKLSKALSANVSYYLSYMLEDNMSDEPSGWFSVNPTIDIPEDGYLCITYKGVVSSYDADFKRIEQSIGQLLENAPELSEEVCLGVIRWSEMNRSDYGDLNPLSLAIYDAIPTWSISDLRKYLNSNDDSWSNGKISMDDNYPSYIGYLSGLSDSFKNVLLSPRIAGYDPNIRDYITTYDKVSIGSMTQTSTYTSRTENEKFEFYDVNTHRTESLYNFHLNDSLKSYGYTIYKLTRSIYSYSNTSSSLYVIKNVNPSSTYTGSISYYSKSGLYPLVCVGKVPTTEATETDAQNES